MIPVKEVSIQVFKFITVCREAEQNLKGTCILLRARGQVNWALDSRSEGLGFSAQRWSCVVVSGKPYSMLPQSTQP